MLEVIETILGGGVAIYPTETLYAVGCDATNPAAARRVVEIKSRPDLKPLPIVIGSLQMLELVAVEVTDEMTTLVEAFWPGPLSVLVQSLETLAPEVRDSDGFTSVRWTPHSLASRLCREVGVPLVSTSANVSGQKPTALPSELDAGLLDMVDEALLDRPWPGGGDPSTLVRLEEGGALTILRAGAISANALQEKGFTIL